MLSMGPLFGRQKPHVSIFSRFGTPVADHFSSLEFKISLISWTTRRHVIGTQDHGLCLCFSVSVEHMANTSKAITDYGKQGASDETR